MHVATKLQIDQGRQSPKIDLDFRQDGLRVDFAHQHALAANSKIDSRFLHALNQSNIWIVVAPIASLEGFVVHNDAGLGAMSNTTLYIMFGSGSSLAPGKSVATSPPGISKAWPDCAKTEPESPIKAANTARVLKNGVFIMISINTDFCFDRSSFGHETRLLYVNSCMCSGQTRPSNLRQFRNRALRYLRLQANKG
jgi:hypothetical protein